MLISRLLLQHFRNYSSADFKFEDGINFIIGPNTVGKSNLLEAIYLLSSGKSFRTEKDEQMVQFGKTVSHIKGQVSVSGEKVKLEVVLAEPAATGNIFRKKYLINDIPKRRLDFAGVFPVLLFEPSDLEIVSGSPSLRREFVDEVLEQTDREYRQDHITYMKALRQRNALLQKTKETGVRQEKQFSYWDEILIRTGNNITDKRTAFIDCFNQQDKSLFPLFIIYDRSTISEARLAQYKEAEVSASATLVGPHRDDLFIYTDKNAFQKGQLLKAFGSRGQQRLAVLQLKLLQLEYMQKKLTERPLLLLDDIFSELDEEHIKHIVEVIPKQQTLLTTTHKEFVDVVNAPQANVIELNNPIIQ